MINSASAVSVILAGAQCGFHLVTSCGALCELPVLNSGLVVLIARNIHIVIVYFISEKNNESNGNSIWRKQRKPFKNKSHT